MARFQICVMLFKSHRFPDIWALGDILALQYHGKPNCNNDPVFASPLLMTTCIGAQTTNAES